MPAKVSNFLLRYFGLFVCFCIAFWIAGQREAKDGFRYFVTAVVVSVVLWLVYCALVYLLAPICSRLLKKK
jgi:uncharacterized membrane protein YbhN (UPF0104 family)